MKVVWPKRTMDVVVGKEVEVEVRWTYLKGAVNMTRVRQLSKMRYVLDGT